MENTVETFRPSMKYLIASAFGLGLFALWMLLAAGLLALVISPLIFFGGIIVTYLSLKNIWIEVRENGLFIQSGIIAKKRTLLLYSQIQDIKETQGIIDIILGIKSISIVTMTSLSAQAGGRLPSFEAGDAEKLKKLVLERVLGTQTAAAKGAKITTGMKQDLGENYFPIQTAKAVISAIAAITILPIAGIILVIALGLAGSDITTLSISFFVLFIFWIFLALIVTAATVIKTSFTKYVLAKNQLEIRFEFLSLSKITIPYEKIQDIILRRGFFERMFGLANVKVETGAMEIYSQQKGQQQVERNIVPALLEKDALELREILSKAIGCSLKERAPALVSEVPLEQKKVLKKTTVAVLPLLVTFAVFAVLIKGALPVLAVAFVILIAIIYVYETVYLKKYFYNLTDNALIIRKGVFTIKEIIIPFDRIQNVFVDQDIFDKIFGLWDTHVSTVTPRSEMHGHIDGVNQQNARKIADMLLEKIKQK